MPMHGQLLSLQQGLAGGSGSGRRGSRPVGQHGEETIWAVRVWGPLLGAAEPRSAAGLFGVEADDPVHRGRPAVGTVLHHQQSGPGGLGRGEHGVADLEGAVGVQVGGGLIQQEQAWAHGQNPGQRQALLLSAGELGGGMLQRQVRQPRSLQRLMDPLGDLLARDGQILRGEGHIIAHPGEDHGRLRVLLHQPGTSATVLRGSPVDQQFPGGGRSLRGQHPGQPMQQCGLPGSRGSGDQHFLSGADLQAEILHRRGASVRMLPGPALGAHCGTGRGLRARSLRARRLRRAPSSR